MNRLVLFLSQADVVEQRGVVSRSAQLEHRFRELLLEPHTPYPLHKTSSHMTIEHGQSFTIQSQSQTKKQTRTISQQRNY